MLCSYAATFSDIVCCRDMDKLTFDFMILIKTAGREQSQAPLPLAACPMLAKINDHIILLWVRISNFYN